MPKTPANSTPAQPTAPSPKVDGAASVDTLPAQYKPAEHEGRVRGAWEASGAFHADPSRVLSGEREPFCVLIPPPNVTAALHLGHAFNNTLQDVLVRAHRMMGFETLWMPGTDHAGIATQAVVERRLRESGELKGPLRDSMTREAFVERAQAWKDEYEAKILGQLKSMGCSCDWERTRFTMDPICARAVREAFFQLFKAGLIYRGKRLVNWDPVLQTAVADDELEMREVEGKFYYLRYPLVTRIDGSAPADWRPVTWSELAARGYPGARKRPEDQPAWITVATTRPETYPGDTAVAVNPKDPRAASLRGLMIELPVVGRVIPIIEDDYVVMPSGRPALPAGSPSSPTDSHHQSEPEADPSASDTKEDPKAKYATGFLKVTPAHDENDYALYQRHKAVMDAAAGGDGKALINIMAPDASISDTHGWTDVGDAHLFVGLSREKAREKVLAEFQSHAIGSETLLEAIKPYTHTLPYSDRSKVPIEPWLSDQWYVKVTDDRLRGEAQRALAREQRSTATFPAREGVEGDGEMRFFPERYAKSYESWHDNLRDWCVSRQLWWGHRVPVWTLWVHSGSTHAERDLREYAVRAGVAEDVSIQCDSRLDEGGCVTICSRSAKADRALAALNCFYRLPTDDSREEQFRDLLALPGVRDLAVKVMDGPAAGQIDLDPDVLDTWFSSGVWPLSTMGWPHDGRGGVEGGRGSGSESRPTTGRPIVEPELLAAFNPSTVLCTGRDIITLWVSRMVMFNRFLLGAEGGPALRAGPSSLSTQPPRGDESVPPLVSVVTRSAAFNAPHYPPLRPARFIGRDPYPKGSPSPGDLLRTQRRLPHVELDRATYFVTWRVVDGETLSKSERLIVKDAVNHWHERGDEVFALSVMTTHVHALVRLSESRRLGAWSESIKRFSATEINKRRGEKGSIWLAEQFDHVVRDEGDLAEFARYILGNAADTGVVAAVTDDRFAWVSEEMAGLIEGGGLSPHKGEVGDEGSPARRAGPPPFRDVYINPIIQDGHGQRMSKSLGNGVDPLDIVHSHGADAMRFVLTQIATGTQDVRMPVDLVCPHTGKTFEPKFITSPQGYQVAAPIQDSPGEAGKKMVTPYGVASGKAMPTPEMPLARTTSSKFDLGRNFCNKLWNASRFALGILGKAGASSGAPVSASEMSLIDRWMLSRVQQTTEGVTRAIQSYQFSTYAQLMYDLMWRDFCDWYLEAIKPTVAASRSQQAVLAHALESIVRLLHPLIPFITESIWERLRHIQTTPIAGVTLGASRVGGLLCSAGWPVLDASLRDERAEATVARLQALSGAIREVRSKHQVPPKRKVVLHASPALAAEIAQGGGIVEALCVLSRVDSGAPAGASVTFAFEAQELRLSDLADAVDAGTERERLTKLVADLRKSIAALDGRLSNPGYADRAPPALVQQTRDEKTRKEGELASALAAIARLG